MLLDLHQRQIFHRLFAGTPVNRLELSRQLGLTPNKAGYAVTRMISMGLLRECSPNGKGRGRPAVPVEIDTTRRQILGVALYGGGLGLAHLNLRGQPLRAVQSIAVSEPAKLIRSAEKAIGKNLTADHFAIGVSATGFMEPREKRLLLSSALAGRRESDLTPLFDAAGKTPVCLQNDMYAMAARWLLTQADELTQDVLLVLLNDGQVGATVLVAGKPISGCILGGNELGHMRMPVATDRCYCGHTGCLERIFSSEYARARLGMVGALPQMIEQYDGKRGGMFELIGLIATGVANATNFLRPHRLVLVSPFTRYPLFANELLLQIRERLLDALAARVRVDLWEQPASTPAETAAYLPLAAMCLEGWR